MMGKIRILIKLFQHWIQSNGREGHGIHSPFIYKFNRDVLNPSVIYKEYHDIDRLYKLICKTNPEAHCKDNFRPHFASWYSNEYSFCKLLFRFANYLNPQTIVLPGGHNLMAVYSLAKGAGENCRIFISAGSAKESATVFNCCIAAGLTGIEVLDDLNEPDGRFDEVDLLYISGRQKPGEVYNQFRRWLPRAHSGSMIIIDCICRSAGMYDIWKRIASDSAVKLSINLFYAGVILFRKGVAKQSFRLRFKK